MGLVDYSDSESDSETPQTSVTEPILSNQPPKKAFQKLVDKTNPGKILVNLPTAASTANDETSSDEPAAKRVKTGGGRFSGFSSFLPPPKTASKSTTAISGSKPAPKVGVSLKTSSEAAFSRDVPSLQEDEGQAAGGALGLNLPPPKASALNPAQPSIPEGQKPEEEVKLVGKPLMFKPLSVARNPTKKKSAFGKPPTPAKPASSQANTLAQSPAQQSSAMASMAETKADPPPARKRVSLFSISDEAPVDQPSEVDDGTSYEPEFTSYDNTTAYSEFQQYPDHQQQYYSQPLPTASHSEADPNSLDSIADDLNLDPVARRELFGRGGAASRGTTAKSVINFNLDQEYRHNEELRASGALDQAQHNPLRAIKPGKHSLQQLVNAVQTQRDALEENFAKNRATQKQAGSKYGFR